MVNGVPSFPAFFSASLRDFGSLLSLSLRKSNTKVSTASVFREELALSSLCSRVESHSEPYS